MVAPHHPLPEWLIAEDPDCTGWFVVHLVTPRFVAEIFDDPETGGNIIGFPAGEIVWLDEPPLDAQRLARLMRETGEMVAHYDEVNDREAERARREEESDEDI